MHVIIRGEGYSPGNNMVLLGRVFKAGCGSVVKKLYTRRVTDDEPFAIQRRILLPAHAGQFGLFKSVVFQN